MRATLSTAVWRLSADMPCLKQVFVDWPTQRPQAHRDGIGVVAVGGYAGIKHDGDGSKSRHDLLDETVLSAAGAPAFKSMMAETPSGGPK